MGTQKNHRIVDPVLTELARGYSNNALVAEKLFPAVAVAKEGGKIPRFNKEAFKIYNTERAIRANSNRISPEGHDSIDYALTEHDLEYPMDYREIEEDILNLKAHAAHVTSEGIKLRHEKLVCDLVQDPANYPAGNKMTLAASDQFTDKTSDPIGVFETAKEGVRSKIAKLPNIAVLGASAYNALKQHPAILDKIKYTQHAIITPDLLKTLLGFDGLFVASAVYSDDEGSFHDMFTDNVVLAYVPQSKKRTYYEPAFAYTLRKKNYPVVDTYEEKGKLLIIRNTDIFTAKIVGAEAGYLIQDTNG